MAIKIKTKADATATPASTRSSFPSITNPLKIPTITPPRTRTQNIIIRAIKIMLMDIRMLVYPKQTKEELEKYSQFADLGYGRK